jgi:hypothetical protein
MFIPNHYLGPFDKDPMPVWRGQWPLDSWINRYLSAALFLYALWLPVRLGHSVVGVFSRRADQVVVGVLRKWHSALVGQKEPVP